MRAAIKTAISTTHAMAVRIGNNSGTCNRAVQYSCKVRPDRKLHQHLDDLAAEGEEVEAAVRSANTGRELSSDELHHQRRPLN